MSSHIAIELFVDDLPSSLLNSFLDVLTHVLVIISQSILLFSVYYFCYYDGIFLKEN